MVRMILAAIVATLLPSAALAEDDIPPGVMVAKENTYSVCGVLKIEAMFGEGLEIRTQIDESCATAFQVSETELLTSTRAIATPAEEVMDFFRARQRAYEDWGIRHNMPVGDMEITSTRYVYSPEGLRFTMPTMRTMTTWGGEELTDESLIELKHQLDRAEWSVYHSEALIDEVARDSNIGLVLLRFKTPLTLARDDYVPVESQEFKVHVSVWSISAYPPRIHSRGRPLLSETPGSIRVVGKPPHMFNWGPGKNAKTYKVGSVSPGTVKEVGGPIVDARGWLVGMTQDVVTNESVFPFGIEPCNVPPPNGTMLNCEVWAIAVEEVFRFLEEARKQ